MPTVAETLVKTLAAAGVKRIYGIVGDSLNGITNELRRQKTIEPEFAFQSHPFHRREGWRVVACLSVSQRRRNSAGASDGRCQPPTSVTSLVSHRDVKVREDRRPVMRQYPR